MKRELSAKDKAFEKERIKFRQKIKSLQDENFYLSTELVKETIIKNRYSKIIEELETQIGISKEELLTHIERNKRLEGTLKLFNLGGIY